MRISTALFWTLGISLALTIVVGPIVAVSMPGASLVWPTMWLFNGHLILATVCVHAYERDRVRVLMVSGVMACILGFAAWTALVWLMDGMAFMGRWGAAIATPLSSLAMYAALVSLLSMLRLRGPGIWLRRMIYVLAAIMALHISLAIVAFPLMDFSGVMEQRRYVQRHMRWNGIYSILIFYGTLACAAAYYVRTLHAGDKPIVPPRPFTLTCPRCGLTQQRQTEGDACTHCGLRIKVMIP